MFILLDKNETGGFLRDLPANRNPDFVFFATSFSSLR